MVSDTENVKLDPIVTLNMKLKAKCFDLQEENSFMRSLLGAICTKMKYDGEIKDLIDAIPNVDPK